MNQNATRRKENIRPTSFRGWFVGKFSKRETIYSILPPIRVQTLSFTMLPKKLQKMVIKSLDLEESEKLLKVNKEMRKESLENGTIRRKVKEIHFPFTPTKRDFCLKVDDNKVTVNLSNFEALNLPKRFFDSLDFCSSVSFNYSKGNFQNSPKFSEFLKNFKFISKFSLNSASFSFVKPFLENFNPRIFERLVMNFHWDEERNQEVYEYFENFGYTNLFLSNSDDHFFFEIFNKVTRYIVCQNLWGFEILRRSLRIFLQNGNSLTKAVIPASGIHSINWLMKIVPEENFERLAEMVFRDFVRIMEEIDGVVEIGEESAEAKSIRGMKEKFEKVTKEELFLRFDSFLNEYRKYFKKKISVNKECIFLLDVMDKDSTSYLGYIDIRLLVKFVPTLALP